MLISVIVPVYNVAPYLRKCMDSILFQTYQNLEIILIDDGSTDESSDICDEYQKRDNRIIVIHQQNGGLSAARNSGLDVAKGDFISFIDSDDWIHQDYFKQLIKYSQVKGINIDIVQCGIIKTHTDQISSEVKLHDTGRVYSGHNAAKMLYEPGAICFIVVCNKLYRKSLFTNLRFPIGKMNEDEFLNYKLLYESSYVISLNDRMYFYRQRNGSIMSKVKNSFNLDALEAYDERIFYFKKNRDKYLLQKTIENYYDLLILKSKIYHFKRELIIKKLKYIIILIGCNKIDINKKKSYLSFILKKIIDRS